MDRTLQELPISTSLGSLLEVGCGGLTPIPPSAMSAWALMKLDTDLSAQHLGLRVHSSKTGSKTAAATQLKVGYEEIEEVDSNWQHDYK